MDADRTVSPADNGPFQQSVAAGRLRKLKAMAKQIDAHTRGLAAPHATLYVIERVRDSVACYTHLGARYWRADSDDPLAAAHAAVAAAG